MAKKLTKKEIVELPKKEIITLQDVLQLAKDKGYTGEEYLCFIQDWIRNNHGLHGEIFYSLYHKKWSINNYFVNIIKGERISWDYKSINYDTYNDTLLVLIYNLLLCL